MSNPVSNAINHIILRDEDGNMLNDGLNELEYRLFAKLESEHLDCASGESAMDTYQSELAIALASAINSVTKKFGIDN